MRCLALCLTVSLSACGGGGGSPVSLSDKVEDGIDTLDPELDNLNNSPATLTEAELHGRLLADYTPLSYTPLALVPTTGSLTYRGIWGGDLSNRSDMLTDSLLGQLEIAVQFTAHTVQIDGNVTGLTDVAGAGMTGQLSVSDGELDRAGDPFADYTLRFSVAGTLTDAAGRSMNVDTWAEGDFLTDTYRAIGGEVLGRVVHAGAVQIITGSFIAER